MTNEEKLKNTLNYDFHILGYAQVAQQYLKQGNKSGIIHAQKALENILQKTNISDPWVVSTITDPEVLKKTIENQLGVYSNCKSQETISELINSFSGDFEKYSEGGANRVKETLKDVLGMFYGDLQRKMEIANYKIKGESLGQTSKEDADKAKKELEKHQNIFATFNLVESSRAAQFQTEVEFSFNTDMFNQLYPIENLKVA